MASYWIVAAAIVTTAWPSSGPQGARLWLTGMGSSNAYVVCEGESRAGGLAEHAIQATDPSSASSASTPSPNAPIASDEVKPAGVTPASRVAASASPQRKDSFLLIELSQTLKAQKLKPGDRIKAKVSQDVVERGRIVVPVDAKVEGHVTEVGVRDAGNSESRLGVVFDRILLKGDREILIQAVVQAIAPPVQRRFRVSEPSQMSPSLFDYQRPGSGRSSRGREGPTVPLDASGSPYPAILQVPFAAEQSGDTRPNAAPAIRSQTTSGQSLSVGAPLGIKGLKGLGLIPGATAGTPGPVVICNRDNVKLYAGTQILLRVTGARVAPMQEK